MWFVLAVICAMFNSYIFTNLFFPSGYILEIVLGWILAITFNCTGLMIKIFAFGQDMKRFFICTFLLTPLNAAIFLATTFLMLHTLRVSPKPFITSIFISYFTFLIYNIFKLRSLDPVKQTQNIYDARI